MAYWNKRKWLPRYQCLRMLTGMIQKPKWCTECEDRYCKGCKYKEPEKKQTSSIFDEIDYNTGM